ERPESNGIQCPSIQFYTHNTERPGTDVTAPGKRVSWRRSSPEKGLGHRSRSAFSPGQVGTRDRPRYRLIRDIIIMTTIPDQNMTMPFRPGWSRTGLVSRKGRRAGNRA